MRRRFPHIRELFYVVVSMSRGDRESRVRLCDFRATLDASPTEFLSKVSRSGETCISRSPEVRQIFFQAHVDVSSFIERGSQRMRLVCPINGGTGASAGAAGSACTCIERA